MKHWSRPGLALFVSIVSIASISRATDLASEIKDVLHDKQLARAQVGIQITRLGADAAHARSIYKLDSDQPLIPASNLKVVTTSAALDALGPDFRFHTSLLSHDGDVVLVGDGDPTFGDSELLKKVGWDVTTVFDNWAAELKKRGVTSVRNVLVDDSVFDENFVHPNWPVEQQHLRYSAQVGGVNLNANCLDLAIHPNSAGQLVSYAMNPDTRYVKVRNTCTSGGENAVWPTREPGTNEIILKGQASIDVPVAVTVNDPPMYAATVMSEVFARSGIKMTGEAKRDRAAHEAYAKSKDANGANGWSILAVHETPLPAVISRANKDSMNLYAECLCKRLGHEATHAPGSWENGTAAVRAFLEKTGVSDDQFKLDDGCGLSKSNRISAAAMVAVLTYDFVSPNRDVFLRSLSVAGVDGTLESRFKGTDLRGRVFGKTGFVNSVSTLSGYLKATDGQWYAFSILINGTTGVKPIQERIVKAVDSLAAREVAVQH